MEIANTSRRNQVKTEAVSTVYYIISQVPHFNLTHISTDSGDTQIQNACELFLVGPIQLFETTNTEHTHVRRIRVYHTMSCEKHSSFERLVYIIKKVRLYISSHQRYVHHLSIYYRLYELHFNYRKSLHSKQMCVDEGFGVRKLIVFH